MQEFPRDATALLTEYLPQLVDRARRSSGVGTYAGCCVVRVLGSGEWTLRVEDQALEVVAGAHPDALGQVVFSAEDYDALVVEVFAAVAENPSALSGTPFSFSAEAADAVRGMKGSIALQVAAPDGVRTVFLLLGSAPAAPAAPAAALPTTTLPNATCVVRCSQEHLLSVLRGKDHPLQLLLRGDLVVTGDTSLPTELALALLTEQT